jgi:hypothetical protein
MNDVNEAINNQKKSTKIGIPKYNTFFTIDPYVSVTEYNQSLQALENNKIEYTEFISLFGNYNWYLSLEDNQRPIMINYDPLNRTNWTKVLSKVKPLTTNDIYLLYRRGEKSDISRFVDNDWTSEAKNKNSIVFTIQSKEELFKLSKLYGKIYPLGTYINGSIKLAICFNEEIKNSIVPSRIKLEMKKHKTGQLELKINDKILRNIDKIIKWTKTPYFENGKFYPTSPQSPLRII